MIKKLIYGLALATGLVACSSDDYTDWANPQHNDQPEMVTFGDGSITEVDAIDFATLAEDQDSVVVCHITAPTSNVSKFTPFYTIVLRNDNGEDDVLPLSAEGKVAIADLKAFIEKTYGKAPTLREIRSIVEMWETDGTQTIFAKASSMFFVKAKLNAPHISEHYYLVGGTQDWATSATEKSQPFSHSDQSVYDDPVFTITFEAAAEGDTWFAIGDDEACEAIGNGDWSKLLGTTVASEATEGMLKPRYELDGDHSLCVPASTGAKYIKVEINMMDGTYKITPLSFEKYLWVPGNAQGWSPETAGRIVSENYNGIYTGYVYVDGGFKFCKAADWNHGDFGGDAGDGKLSNGGGNLDWGKGVYYVEVDLVNMTYTKTLVESMSLIGDFNGWSGDVDLTWDAANSCFTGDCSAVTANGWKFRINHEWNLNLGGEDCSSLWNGGNNLSATGSTVKLYPLRLQGVSDNIYCTVE